MLMSDFNKVAKKPYLNPNSSWVLSFKFAAYFQNTFSQEQLKFLTLKLIPGSDFYQLLQKYTQELHRTQNSIALEKLQLKCLTGY